MTNKEPVVSAYNLKKKKKSLEERSRGLPMENSTKKNGWGEDLWL